MRGCQFWSAFPTDRVSVDWFMESKLTRFALKDSYERKMSQSVNVKVLFCPLKIPICYVCVLSIPFARELLINRPSSHRLTFFKFL